MIYTVTFNPSLDYIVSVRDFQMGMTNRTETELMLPGGKGINVSIVLQNLGVDSTALGFTAGFVGEEIQSRLRDYGIRTEFIEVQEGVSRINVKLRSVDGTEINGQGPVLTETDIHKLTERLEELHEGDLLVLAGSIPTSVSDDIYEKICERMVEKKVSVVVDATSKLLLNVLKHHPFLIKPNHHELGEIFDVTLRNREEVVPYAKKLCEMGAQNVLISMGGQGAVLVTVTGEVYEGEAPTGILVNSVGAGDSMVAGFLAGFRESGTYERALAMGLATGSASAFSENLATGEEVREVLHRTVVRRVQG